VDFLLLGSFDIFIENDIPEAGFSVRLLDIENMHLFWAASEAASGNDFSGLFGIGQIKQADKLIHRLVKNAFKNFNENFTAYIKEKTSTLPAAPIFALVTFDNLSGQRYAGEIMSNILLTELISRGKIVVEPGTVRELLRSKNSAPRGGIDYELMSELQRNLGVDFVLTGSVNHFKPGIGGVESAAPEIEFGGRCLDSGDGRIIAAYEYCRLGSDSDALLNFGSPNSLGDLSQKVINDFLNKLDKDLN
jgi:TolB-like protein